MLADRHVDGKHVAPLREASRRHASVAARRRLGGCDAAARQRCGSLGDVALVDSRRVRLKQRPALVVVALLLGERRRRQRQHAARNLRRARVSADLRSLLLALINLHWRRASNCAAHLELFYTPRASFLAR